jgi:hypothetical protein
MGKKYGYDHRVDLAILSPLSYPKSKSLSTRDPGVPVLLGALVMAKVFAEKAFFGGQ